MLQSVLKYFGYVPEPMPQVKPRPRKQKAKKKVRQYGKVAPQYLTDAKKLDINQSFIIEKPKMVLCSSNNKYYAYPYVSYLNNKMPTKRFTQMTYQGKCIIARTK